jgi:hypothetical protein
MSNVEASGIGDGRAVEAHAALEGVLELFPVDREALEVAQDVGEPEADESNVALVTDRGNVLRRLGGVVSQG